MADFGYDTAVAGRDGRYTGRLSEDWKIWVPQGGYVASVALRAAGAHSAFPRPASLACHFLRVAAFGPVELRVETLRRTRRAESTRVTVLQGEAPVLEALVWVVDELSGLDHGTATMPEVPSPAELEPWERHLPGGEPPFAFWRNFDVRPVSPQPTEWERATEPRSLGWTRLLTPPDLADPFVDAARMLVAADAAMYPAAVLAHDELFPYVAPSLDLTMSFHDAAAGADWLLTDAVSPLSRAALVSGTAAVWSEDGRLLASAMQQMLQRT
jgi:acyl-CoA thioesterase II